MTRKIIISALALLGPLAAPAGTRLDATASAGPDSARVFAAILEHGSPAMLFRSAVMLNPAVKTDMSPNALSSLRVNGYMGHDEAPLVMQTGQGGRHFSITTDSYRPLNKNSTVWGAAAYRNGVKKNIRWGATSDYHLLYPYVSADAAGGDMKSEQYNFSGGYGRHFNSVRAAVEGSFRALHEYRTYDPRPRNISYDMHLRAGVSTPLSSGYTIAASLGYRVYRQTERIQYYYQAGSARRYSLTGLGTYYYNLSNNSSTVNHRGKALSGSVELFSPVGKGFYARAAYDKFTCDRLFPTGENYSSPHITTLHVYGTEVEAGYTATAGRFIWGAGLTGSIQNRRGVENIIADPGTNYYETIGSLLRYRNDVRQAGLKMMLGSGGGTFSWSAEPFAGYGRVKVRYADVNDRSMDISVAQAGLKLSLWRRWDKTMVRAGVSGSHSANLSADIMMPVINTDTEGNDAGRRQDLAMLREVLMQNFAAYASDYTLLCGDIETFFRLGNGAALTAGFRLEYGIRHGMGRMAAGYCSLGLLF